MTMLGHSPKISMKWPSMLSVASSDGGGSQGCLSPSMGRPGALNIFRAAEAGDVDLISRYLIGGGNANKAGKEGYTILHLAAMRNQEDMVKLLLAGGADPDVHDKGEGLTPLMWAAQLGHAEVAILLLEAGADSEQEDREDLTALHWAARMGKERTLAVLLDHRADVEAVDYDGNTPLIWAAREGHRGCANRLLGSGASVTIPDENGNTALHFACQMGHAEIVSDLLDKGALATAQDYWQFTPFHRACSQGHGDVLEELLRPRPLSWGKIKRMYSFEEGDESIGGDLGDGDGSGGHEALPPLMPSLGIVPTPLSFTIDLRNHFNATPLHRAAAKGHAQVVSMLLENGAEVNARDGFFYTPLHLACVNGAAACVQVLLRAGADPTPKAQGGVTPLLLAARKNQVRELIEDALRAWSPMDVCISSESESESEDESNGSLDRKNRRKTWSTMADGQDLSPSFPSIEARGAGGGHRRGERCTVRTAGGISIDIGDAAWGLKGDGGAEQRSKTTPPMGAVDVRTISAEGRAAVAAGGGVAEVSAAPAPAERKARSVAAMANAMDVDGDNNDDDLDDAISEPLRRFQAVSFSAVGAKGTEDTRLSLWTERGGGDVPVVRTAASSFYVGSGSGGSTSVSPSTQRVETPTYTSIPAPAPTAPLSDRVGGETLSLVATSSERAVEEDGRRAVTVTIPFPPERLLHTALRIAPPTLTGDAIEAVAGTEAQPESSLSPSQVGTVPLITKTAPSPLPPSPLPLEPGGVGDDTPSLTTLSPALESPSIAVPTVTSLLRDPSFVAHGNRLHRPSLYATDQLMAAVETAAAEAAAAEGTMEAEARATMGTKAVEVTVKEHRSRTYKRRRARSLPPTWDNERKYGQPPRAPRRPRLESRPCMQGPTAVIENLALDDDCAVEDDAALNAWIREVGERVKPGAGARSLGEGALAVGWGGARAAAIGEGNGASKSKICLDKSVSTET
ncbi:unnamed protein product [Ascophyllum nodosum]